MKRIFTENPTFFICLLLVAATLAVYLQMLNFDFINYDDPAYVTENPYVQQGLTVNSIRWAFTTTEVSAWQPLTWLSLMIDYHFFGLNAGLFHLTNLLLHIATTLLLFIVLNRCTAAVWHSAFVAAIFALHPLNVESVAWIAERKGVLSTFFWMLTMLAYVRFTKQPGITRYLLALAAFTLGLMAKPMLVTLPCVLLLMDYWPLGRMRLTQLADNEDTEEYHQAGTGNGKSPLFLVLEKIPFFILTAASSVVAFITQRSGGALATLEAISLKSRISNTLISYVSYIAKMLWPVRLAIFYPHRGDTLPIWLVLISAMFLLCISVLVIWQGSRRRYLLFGWLWYIGTLVPVIGLVQVGSHSMADRYTYVPLIGLFIIVAWLIHELLRKWQYRRMVFTLLALTAITASMICTWLQTGHWQNSERVFSHAISVTSGNFTAHNNLGIVFAERGDIEQAIEHFTATLKIRQNDIEARFNLAKALDMQGKAEQAIRHYNVVLRLKPGKAEAHSSLGLIFFRQGKLEQAVEAYRRGLRFNPSDVPLHTNLGAALIRQGRIDAAISEFQAALEASPDSETYCNLGLALGLKGLFDEAMKHYNEAIRLWPGNAKAYYLFANILMAQDRVEEAVSKYRETLKIDPQHKKARQNLKEALAILNKTDKPAGKRK